MKQNTRTAAPYRSEERQGLVITYRVLIGIAVLLALTLAAGSIYALLRGPMPEKSPEAASPASGETVFSGIGQIRVATAGPNPATVVLGIAFPYPPEDRDFAGEIESRTEEFRRIASLYFSSLSAARIRQNGEAAVKAEILGRFNSLLRLGRIEKLYFSEYMIID